MSLSTQTHQASVRRSWFNRLKVGQKIGLGYILSLGVAIGGTAIGIAIGHNYQNEAQRIQEDAIEEIVEIKDLEQALTQLIIRERQLLTWLDNPVQFRKNYAAYQAGIREFNEEWSELISEYEEDIEAGIEEPEEIELLQDVIENYGDATDVYLQDVDQLIADLNIQALQGEALLEARQAFIDLDRRPSALKLQEFATRLADLVELIETEELEEAENVIESARELRTQALAVSVVLSLMLASLLAALISRAITRPIKAVEEVALQVTRQKDFDLRTSVTSDDEIGTLATTLNQLIEWVGAYTLSLKATQQDLEQQTQELNAIIDNLGDGLLVVDPQGHITRSNPALRQMFSLDTAKLSGQPVKAHFEGHIPNLIHKNQTEPEIRLTEELTLSAERIGQARVTAIVSDTASELVQGQAKLSGSVVLVRDITAEKEVDQMKTDFISTVSHELRTPLTSVLGFAKLIQKKLEDTILPVVTIETKKTERAVRQVRENLSIIVSEGERLTSLINDVLDIAKIEAGKIEWNMQSVTVSAIIERAIAATFVLAQNSELDILQELDADLPVVTGDYDRLLQVVINLLSNAIKFTDSGSVTCRAYQQENEIIVSIIDTGIGLAADDVDKVFEKFKQVGEVMTDKPKGTGLGLPICKQIIEHHGGRIWAESDLGQGSTFSFTLPLKSSAPNQGAAISLKTLVADLKDNVNLAVTADEKTQKTILVVDDEPHIRNLLRQELEAADYQVKEAKDGMDALNQVKLSLPDLIIMDVMMPNINGFDLAAVLKNNPATMDIPTIVLSIIQDQDRGYRLGVDRYLSKPIDTDVLMNDIKTLLAKGTSSRKVLVVDIDTSTTRALTEVLLSKGYTVAEATTGPEGIEKALSFRPDMIIVDSSISVEHNLIKTLRFDNGLENIFFIMVEQSLDADVSEVSTHDVTS